MEFETISSAPLLDKNGWYRADDPWAGAPLVLRNTKGSADSEGSCTPTDVGTWPTQPSDAGAAVWDSLCAEWDGNQAVTVEAEAGSTSTQHQELSSSSPYELYVLAEQQELWDLEAWTSSDQDEDEDASEENTPGGTHGDDSGLNLGCDIPVVDAAFAATVKPVEYGTPPSSIVAATPIGVPPLNSHGLFDKCNFRDMLPNERGRGAFVGALLGLLEQGRMATNHLHADRSVDSQHRWSLNRLPGCTERLLRFINTMLVEVIGLKPFVTWRSLARCLGDTRSYLSPKHWACLELKGGGKMASARSPWQSYKTYPGHFDQLREEFVQWLLCCNGGRQSLSPASWDPSGKGSGLATRRARTLPGLSCCDEKALAALVQTVWTRAEQEEPADSSASGDNAGVSSRGDLLYTGRADGSSKTSISRGNLKDGARSTAGGKTKRRKHTN